MGYKNLYFLINSTDNINEIGHYPQITLNKNYNPNFNGHWKVPHNEFPDFIPNLELVLHPKGNRTDYMHFGDLRNGFIVSEKLKNILSEYYLPKHQFYPIKISQKKELLNYYWFFYIIEDFWKFLDKEKSYAELVNADSFPKVERQIDLISSKQVLDEEKKFKFPYKLRTGCITMSKEVEKYDFYQIQCLGYQKLFSNRLVEVLKAENISGFELSKYESFKISK